VRSIVRTLYHHRNEREREKRKSKKCTYMVDCNVRVSKEVEKRVEHRFTRQRKNKEEKMECPKGACIYAGLCCVCVRRGDINERLTRYTAQCDDTREEETI